MSETSPYTLTFTITPEKIRRITVDALKNQHFSSEEANAFLRLYYNAIVTRVENTLKNFIVEKLT